VRTGTYRNETRVLCVQNGALGRSRTLATGARGRTLWTGSTRLTEAQGARGEVLRGRSVTLLGVTNGGATDAPKKAPGRTEPATKKAHKAHSEPARRRSNASSLQAFFVGFCAALKGLDNQHMHSRTPAVSGRVLHVPKRQGYARSLLNDSGSPGG